MNVRRGDLSGDADDTSRVRWMNAGVALGIRPLNGRVMAGLLAGLLLVALVLASCNSEEDNATVPVLDDSPSETKDATRAKQSESASSSTTTGSQIDRTDLSRIFSRGQCQGKERVRLTAAPADPNDLAYIFPMGLMTGAHVTPVDH